MILKKKRKLEVTTFKEKQTLQSRHTNVIFDIKEQNVKYKIEL